MSSILPVVAVVLLSVRTSGVTMNDSVCQSYKILSDPWRNVGFNFSWKTNDLNLSTDWYRFSGIGGNRLVYSCLGIIPKYRSLAVMNTTGKDLDLLTCDVVTNRSYHYDCGGGVVLYFLIPTNGTYITRHSSCLESSCGDLARCGQLNGSCECDSGISIPDGHWPTGDSYGCSELDLQIREECKTLLTTECAEEFLESIKNITSQVLPKQIVERYLGWLLNFTNALDGDALDQDRLAAFGNAVLNAVEKLAATLVKKTNTSSFTNIRLQTLNVQVFVVGPYANISDIICLSTPNATMGIDLIGISKKNYGSAAVSFIGYTNMDRMLSPNLFNTTKDTVKIMMSEVISATLPKTANTELTEPVNFTLRHITDLEPDGLLSCVYWKETQWTVDGCYITQTNSSHTTCSCAHLSTFALILQSGKKPSQKSNLHGAVELLGTIAVAVGLLFLSLALLTLAFCRRHSRVTNTALLNLCLSLLLAHLLFLLTQHLLQQIKLHKMMCDALAGVLHFLFLSAFMWMFIEAVLLFISVKNLTKIRSSPKEMLGWKWLIVIGYLIPLVVVGVSAGLFPDGYGSEKCWLRGDKNFTWSFIGPVCFILTSNIFLFTVIIIMLKRALEGLQCEVSQFRQARILVFKTLLQSVILGCTWILGFFTEGNEVLETVFVFLNSQQGTFIFVVHCVFNEEVRQQYRKWFSVVCSWSRPNTSTTVKKK